MVVTSGCFTLQEFCATILTLLIIIGTSAFIDSLASERCATKWGDSSGWCINKVQVPEKHERLMDVCGLVINLDALRKSPMKDESYYVIESTDGDKTIDCGLIVSDNRVKKHNMFRRVFLSPLKDGHLEHISKFLVQNVSTEDVRLVTYRVEQIFSDAEELFILVCKLLQISCFILWMIYRPEYELHGGCGETTKKSKEKKKTKRRKRQNETRKRKKNTSEIFF